MRTEHTDPDPFQGDVWFGSTEYSPWTLGDSAPQMPSPHAAPAYRIYSSMEWLPLPPLTVLTPALFGPDGSILSL